MGVAFYFVTVWALPAVYASINIIPGKGAATGEHHVRSDEAT